MEKAKVKKLVPLVAILILSTFLLVSGVGAAWLQFFLTPFSIDHEGGSGTFEVVTVEDWVVSGLSISGPGFEGDLVNSQEYEVDLYINHGRTGYLLSANFYLECSAPDGTPTIISGVLTDFDGTTAHFIEYWTPSIDGTHSFQLSMDSQVWTVAP